MDLEDVGDVVGVVVFDALEAVEEVVEVLFFGTVVEVLTVADEGAVDDVWFFMLVADDLPIFNI